MTAATVIKSKQLANEMGKLLTAEPDLTVCTAAITMIVAAWLVKIGPEAGDDFDDVRSMLVLSESAMELAEKLRERVGKRGPVDEKAEAERRVAAMPSKPVRRGPSPWGL